MNKGTKEYFSSLEGLRGYAFLVVFVIHYLGVTNLPQKKILYPFFILKNTVWFLVPIFFVLSGFLITRILLSTREREGYFRVFYQRRALRILPLYYLIVLLVFGFNIFNHLPLGRSYLSLLVYLQNFTYLSWAFNGNLYLGLGHLWSLAVEEQFYLIWPLVIWLFPTEKMLLRISYGIVIFCTFLRIAYPLFHLPYNHAYFYTPTRVDAIILGSILAIHYKRAVHWNTLVKASRILIPLVWGIQILLTVIRGTGWTNDYLGVAFSIPAMNLIGACFVVLSLNPTGWLNKVCSGNLICNFGRMTYSLYILHDLYLVYFTDVLVPRLDQYMPHFLAKIVMVAAAFSLTMALAFLTYWFIEKPAMRWKDKFAYGPRRDPKPEAIEVTTVREPQPLEPTLVTQ